MMQAFLALAALQPAADPSGAKPLVPFPHPLITEVLYAVPTGAGGDATGDGTRDVNGDEFIELINPHDQPINLRGYTLSGKQPKSASFKPLTFTFPDCELKPGEVAVVFNGHAQTWKGPVGDSSRAPEAPNELYANARTFTMRVSTSKLGLVNKADLVLLTAPSGERIHCITWGDITAPADTALTEAAPAGTRASVTRFAAGGPLQAHADPAPFSPGQFPPAAPTLQAP